MPLSAVQKDKLAQIVAHLDNNETSDSDSLMSIAMEIIGRESPLWLLVAQRGSRRPVSFMTAGEMGPYSDDANAPLLREVRLWLRDADTQPPKQPEMTKGDIMDCWVTMLSATTEQDGIDATANYIRQCVEREPEPYHCAAAGLVSFSKAMVAAGHAISEGKDPGADHDPRMIALMEKKLGKAMATIAKKPQA